MRIFSERRIWPAFMVIAFDHLLCLTWRQSNACSQAAHGINPRVGFETTQCCRFFTRPAYAVLGKGARWRIAYLTAQSQQALSEWIRVRGSRPGALFVAIHRSGRIQNARLSTKAVARIVRRRAIAAGVGNLRPHDLRQAMATHLLECGVDVLRVQRMLGHRSVSTTETYDRRLERTVHPLMTHPGRVQNQCVQDCGDGSLANNSNGVVSNRTLSPSPASKASET